ncbi:MAG: hypothetical protein Q4G14_06650 [Paracoccus sp. (in: a-proteobacteria)]|uniref:hypothetical protein n=1 Tax=Paracoccus sp. TaxID=267 RepID=UPI0026E09D64|nr:hypothetical protein [Paracoccus sp. (in: a-proteobacteria)]MDO5612908.1 hypothetical protein [Paracoccus sp. (in: a-proteobacteria)]
MRPIPAFTGLILLWLALRSALERRLLLAGFLTLCGLQSLGVAMVSGYGVQTLRPVLPVSAAMIPPFAWIGRCCSGGLARAICCLIWRDRVLCYSAACSYRRWLIWPWQGCSRAMARCC